jgi:hypothetical protein
MNLSQRHASRSLIRGTEISKSNPHNNIQDEENENMASYQNNDMEFD